MSTRNPTAWNEYIEEEMLLAPSRVEEVTAAQLVDDQVFCLDTAQLLVSAAWYDRTITVVNGVYTEVFRFYVTAKDMCDVPAGAADPVVCSWVARAWSASANDFTIRLTNVTRAENNDLAVTAGETSAVFRGTGTINIDGNGDENELLLQITRDAGSGAMHMCGLMVWAPVT